MLLKTSERRKIGKAELKFRDAFERLKSGKPDIISKGAQLSQNNIAKEAGVDPSALRRSRFPELVAEIQLWIETHKEECIPISPRQMVLVQRSKNRGIKEQLKALKEQRDIAHSELITAQAYILELMQENQYLREQLLQNDSKKLL